MPSPAPESRRTFVKAAGVAAVGALGAALAAPGAAAAAVGAPPRAPMVNRGRYRLFPAPAPEYSARAVALVQRALVIDMLSPLTLDFPKQAAWEADPERFTDADFQPFRDSGITAVHPAIGLGGPNAYEGALKFFAGWNALLAGQDQRLLRVDSAADFARAKATGRLGVILGLQNAEHFRRPDDVDYFRGLGQRVAQLTYNSRNLIGNGATERRDEGLSDFGVAVVERMNRAGMAVDVSHCGDRTTLDAFEASRRPVLVTHSNCRALAGGHPRDKSDEAIRALGKSGGVMGVTAVRMFVRDREPTTVEHVLDHYDHVARLIGAEHLGVGSDIDLYGYDKMPPALNKQLRASYKGSYGFRARLDVEGLDHPRRVFDLTEGLIRRRYTDAQIEGVLGGNFRRVLAEVWAPAA